MAKKLHEVKPTDGLQETVEVNGRTLPVIFKRVVTQRGKEQYRAFFTGSQEELNAILDDQRRNPRQAPQMVEIYQVTKLNDETNGKRYAFNRGQFVLSLSQLQAQGCFVPQALIGQSISISFLQEGELGVNRSIFIQDPDTPVNIPNQFTLPMLNADAVQKKQEELYLASLEEQMKDNKGGQQLTPQQRAEQQWKRIMAGGPMVQRQNPNLAHGIGGTDEKPVSKAVLTEAQNTSTASEEVNTEASVNA